IFGGGAALGAVGWWMVSSGLGDTDRTSVSQYRLAFHLTLACVIYAAIVWTTQQLSTRAAFSVLPRLRVSAAALLLLVLLQIYLGALVAGLDAGLIFNTWPLIDGAFIPDTARLWFDTPWWRNLFENALTAQFNHRMLAYTIWGLTILHAVDAVRGGTPSRVRIWAFKLAGLVTLQAALGVTTLLYAAPLPLALAHQAFAIVVLSVAVVHAARLTSHSRVKARDPARQTA
ncbi:MAG: COX15/CtaA family protein, partial [Pseudolabrys sp.]|nr:COX15/CtaA family protein [Pseudolabrys sp.]